MDRTTLNLLRLHLSPGLGRTALFKLQRYFGDFNQAVQAAPLQLRAAGLSDRVSSNILPADAPELHAAVESLTALNARLLSYWDPDYPALLRQIHDPPALLYLRGRLPEKDCFAMVGSRNATSGGLQLTRELARDLAEHDICVVSGLARGVDSAAHRGALDAAGSTIAVLGCGIDRIYPPENSRLFHQILEQNAIISEYPPGTPPHAGHFPGRNRIISGLSRGVLIVEAAEKSGSLITGDFALEQGRELFASPGAVKSPTSSGANRLLKDGAQLVTEVNDILQALWPQRLNRQQQKHIDRLTEQLVGSPLEVYRQLNHEPQHIDEIGRKCGLTPMELSAILLDLELRGGVQVLPGNHFIRGQI